MGTGTNSGLVVGAGSYQLVRRLATGGMAEIWLARQQGIAGFEKQVVLKRTLPQHSDDDGFVAMFLDEARLIASLHHPNIVQVHDIGAERGRYFYVMEHLDGHDVGRIQRTLERRAERMPLEHAILIAMGAAAGLHAAHEARDVDGHPLAVVHRDVSPANLIVTFDGSVKLIDFGVAKASRRRAVTDHGVVKGKVCFMSPEQLLCQPLDRRSDVFALGILLYELTVGERLFDGASEFDVMKQIVERPVPRPSERVPGYPAALEAVVLRALARRPDDRFETAHDVVVALEDVADHLGLVPSQWALGRYVRDLGLGPADRTEPAMPSVSGLASSVAAGAPSATDDRFERMDTIDLLDESHDGDDEDASTEESVAREDDGLITVEEPPDDVATPRTGRAYVRAATPTVEVGLDPSPEHVHHEITTAPSLPRPRRTSEEPDVRVEFRRPRATPAPPETSPLGTGPLPRLSPRRPPSDRES